jgi:hypothetical protein|tara:strand:+ start:2831 stop:3175 length:345 start_codon:yes stop_codon:yes gene_type:complete
VETVIYATHVSALDTGAEMSLHSYSARRDRNERQIVDGLRSMGALVIRLQVVDLLVLYRDQLYMIEVKTDTGRLTRTQQKMTEEGWPIHIARSLPAALRVLMGDGAKRSMKDLE